MVCVTAHCVKDGGFGGCKPLPAVLACRLGLPCPGLTSQVLGFLQQEYIT